jgi:hypothetical protein
MDAIGQLTGEASPMTNITLLTVIVGNLETDGNAKWGGPLSIPDL